MPERVSDSDYPIPDLRFVAVTKPQFRQRRTGIDLEDRNVRPCVGFHVGAAKLLAVMQFDDDLVRVRTDSCR